jgi:hypothetical protein
LLVQHADKDPDFTKRALGLTAPLVEAGQVDERRAAIGLPSMAAYKDQMRTLYDSDAAKSS